MKLHPRAVALKHDKCGQPAFVWLRTRSGKRFKDVTGNWGRNYVMKDFRQLNGRPIQMIGRLRCNSCGDQVGLSERFEGGDWVPVVIECPDWAKEQVKR